MLSMHGYIQQEAMVKCDIYNYIYEHLLILKNHRKCEILNFPGLIIKQESFLSFNNCHVMRKGKKEGQETMPTLVSPMCYNSALH